MADVKWIKITVDMFDNRKIKHLRKLPEGNSIVLIWVMLLTLAGRCNAGGMIFLTENIPYTTKMLADELEFEENTVKLALEALERLGMISSGGEFLSITGWAEHQNVEGMEKLREQNRARVAKHRREKKLLEDCNVTRNVTVTLRNATDIEEEGEEDKNKNKNKKREEVDNVVASYNSLCPSLPAVKTLSDSRKRAIKARLKDYTLEDLEEAFKLAEESRFLKGENDRSWKANFDWLIKETNLVKVLEGNYKNKEVKHEEPMLKLGEYI